MSTLEAWPFVVARNATLDWRPILAPAFLVDAQADYLLVTETADAGQDPAQLSQSVIESSKVGTMTLVFRSVPATSSLLSRTPVEPLLDRFGRPLHVVEGLVIRGADDGVHGDLGAAVDGVRAETLRLMPAFWKERSETAPAARSTPVHITVADRASAGPPEQGERPPRNERWPPLPLAVVLLVVVGAATWWWLRAS